MRAGRDGGSPPGRRARRPRQARTGPALVGGPHDANAAQDPHRLRRMSRAHPRNSSRGRGINRGRARCPESGHAGFGGRLHGKGPNLGKPGKDLAVQPTLLLPAGGRRAERPAGQPRPRPAAGRPAENGPARRPVAGPAGGDGPAAPVPPPEIRALRDLTRTRLQLVRDRSREGQRLEELLEGALGKLSSVVHSLAKVQSARAILEAIAAGERDPKALAALAHPNVKGGRAAVEETLGGMALGDHHPMLIRVHLDHITLLDRSVAEVEDEIEAALDAIPAAWGTDPGGETGPDAGRGPDPAVLPAAERLAEIPGVSPALARAIIAETGLDMTRFQTADHLVSWAGLAPAARPSGPRSRKPKKRQGDAYLRGYVTH